MLPSLGLEDRDLGTRISRAYDVPVFLDNDANAAAVGCSYLQSSYGSITYHRESFGHEVGGQGMVEYRRLHRGKHSFAVELNHLLGVMRFSTDPADLAWTEDGMYELVSRWLLVNVVEHAPDAIYVDAQLLLKCLDARGGRSLAHKHLLCRSGHAACLCDGEEGLEAREVHERTNLISQ